MLEDNLPDDSLLEDDLLKGSVGEMRFLRTRDSVAWWILMEACSRILFFKVVCMRIDSEDSRSNLYLLRYLCYYKIKSWRIVSVYLNN
jgi:hypothetical protein